MSSEQTDKEGLECKFCNKIVQTLIRGSFWNVNLWICKDCYDLIDKNKHKPYSRVMEKYALLSSSYYLNRKIARMK